MVLIIKRHQIIRMITWINYVFIVTISVFCFKTQGSTDDNTVNELLENISMQLPVIARELHKKDDGQNKIENHEKSKSEETNDFRKSIRRELLREVNQGWKRPKPEKRGGKDITSEAYDAMREHLKSIFIPRIEFRDTPLSEVVRTLSKLSEDYSTSGEGINFVLIDPEGLDPPVNITLQRLSMLRILDFIVESVGFGYDIESDAVIIRRWIGPGLHLETSFFPMSRATLIRLTGMTSLNESQSEIPDPFYEEEAGAGKEHKRRNAERTLQRFFEKAGVPFEGIEGATLALTDDQLIVTQTTRNLDLVRKILRRYREIKQVEIEARFIEVQARNLEELGIEWNVSSGGEPAFDQDGVPILKPDGSQKKTNKNIFTNAPVRNLANAFTVGKNESRVVIDRPGLDLPGLPQGPPAMPTTIDLAEDSGDLANIHGVIENADVNMIVRALERQSGNDLLSAPKLTVLSGKSAEIVVAEEFRYPEMYGDTDADVGRGDSNSGSAGVAITAGTPRDFVTRNVGVEMEVTPTVEEDNAISLTLAPTVTQFEGYVEYGGTSVAIASDTTVTVPSGFYQPIFSIRKVNTEVTIWDGSTVVMGGLTREEVVQISDKIPVLGDIPVLGKLFRNEGESTQKRNLLIFVTASLVSPGGSPAFQKLEDVPPNTLFQMKEQSTPAGFKERAAEE